MPLYINIIYFNAANEENFKLLSQTVDSSILRQTELSTDS